ncbi:hypothetical protein LXL04_023950 [Taraxacum kok-saghyz]
MFTYYNWNDIYTPKNPYLVYDEYLILHLLKFVGLELTEQLYNHEVKPSAPARRLHEFTPSHIFLDLSLLLWVTSPATISSSGLRQLLFAVVDSLFCVPGTCPCCLALSRRRLPRSISQAAHPRLQLLKEYLMSSHPNNLPVEVLWKNCPQAALHTSQPRSSLQEMTTDILSSKSATSDHHTKNCLCQNNCLQLPCSANPVVSLPYTGHTSLYSVQLTVTDILHSLNHRL